MSTTGECKIRIPFQGRYYVLPVALATDLEESMGKYMKLSKKKDNEKIRAEAASDVAAMRKKFHQVIPNPRVKS